MKKLNHKQLAYSARKVLTSKLKKMLLLYALVFGVFAVSSAVSFVQGDNESGTVFILTGATAAKLATFISIGHIDDPTDKYTQGNRIAWEVYLVHTDQIDTSVQWPYPNASREVADIPLLAGQYPLSFKCHSNPKYNATGEKGDYTIDPTKTFDLVLGDTFKNQVLNLIEDYAGGKYIIFFREVETSQKYILGTYDKPMYFQSYELKNDDASVALIKFQNKSIRQYYKYVGSIQTAAPTEIADDATALTVGTSDKYNTANGNTVSIKTIATVTGIAPVDYQRTITIYGTGGTYPHAIANSTVFILKNEETWTGTAGSRITLRIVDSDTLVEIERVQA
jgi:hypothetical protein